MNPFSKVTRTLSEATLGPLSKAVPDRVKETFWLRAFGLLKVRMLLFVSPSVVELNETRCEIKIPLNRRTKNHLNSMYFGVLAAGADCAGGMIAMRMIQQEGDQASLLFKEFHAEFLKRAEGDTHFICEDGAAIREMVKRALLSGERENMPVHVTAKVPSKLGDEPVAKFTLTLSIKRKK